jgi:hypothetical protein
MKRRFRPAATILTAALALWIVRPSAQTQRHYVRIDPTTGDLDVTFYERVGMPDFRENSGPLRSLHVVLANHSIPRFVVRVTPATGGYDYAYELQNGDGARQNINGWYLVVPPATHIDGCHAPTNWVCLPAVETPADPRALYYLDPPGIFLRWATPSRNDHPGPATLQSGQRAAFAVSASWLPGYVRAFVESGFVQEPSDIPEVVWTELRPFMTLEGSTQRQLVVGPAFPPGSRPSAMAGSLIAAVRQQITNGELRADSQFVVAALDILTRVAQTDQRSAPPTTQPSGAAEQQLETAIRIDVSTRQ